MDDLISRQAAIDLLKQMRKDGDMIPWEGKDVFARIRKLPTAQPKTGKWNMCYDDDAPQDGIWFCSVCGYARFVDDTFPQNFCPNCGCRMMEGE